jgi:CRP/FNR family transcriptional regulator, anaerobic regulatory protein
MVQSVEVLSGKHKASSGPLTQLSPSVSRTLGVGDYLFREAESRTSVYKVEKGVVAVFERRVGRPANIIEMAAEGDYLGLGCLEQHRDNARAVVDSIVSILPRSEFALLVAGDPQLRQQQNKAIARDFEYGKVLANDRGRLAPIECVAAFLVAVSRQNAHEGRDPTIVADSLKCGLVTSLLDLDISTLSRTLLKLQHMGLVEQSQAAGLHLKDIKALERIADGGDHQPIETAFDGMPARAVVRQRPSSLRRLAASLGVIINPSSSRGGLPEAAWLASVIGGLSVVGVGLAVMIAIALQ